MLKVGVLGAGHLGKIHIRLLLELSDKFDFVGFFDPNEENAKHASEEFGIRRFDNIDELLDAVDCIDIVTPTINAPNTYSWSTTSHELSLNGICAQPATVLYCFPPRE